MRPVFVAGLCAASLLSALGLVMVTVERETLHLVADERGRVEAMYVAARERELQHYVLLARAAIERIAAEPGEQMVERQRQALAILGRMQFGQDGYFFVYDRDGRTLLDPEQMDTQGVAFCEPSEPAGQQQALLILDAARQGGGLVRYAWARPASSQPVAKMSYVTTVTPWGWTLGAGLYLDEVQDRLRQLDERGRDSIARTRERIVAITAFVVGLAALGWLASVLWQRRTAQRRLYGLVERLGQARDGERARLGRELHDGVIQVVVSSRHLIEAAQRRLATSRGGDRRRDAASLDALLQSSLARLDEVLSEIRRVSHGMLPASLEGHDLPDALSALVAQWEAECPAAISLHLQSPPRRLPGEHRLALLRITQEAVVNACRHANAASIAIHLATVRDRIHLSIRDDGCGFDPASVGMDGVGLRNMRARAESLGGQMQVHAGAPGTRIDIDIPRPAAGTEDAS